MSATAKKGPGRPKDAQLPERRREEILDAAATLFAQHGYRNTDMEYVAQALSIAKGTIYRYFASKEELFLAAADRGMRRAGDFVDASIVADADPLERMAHAVRAYLTFFRNHPQFVELLIQERAEFRDRPQQTYFAYRDRRMAPWREVFRGLIAQGRIRQLPPEQIVTVLCNLVYGTMFTNYFTGQQDPPERQAADIMDIVLNGLLTGRQSNPLPASASEARHEG
ncbi:MAG TPA: TetR/AcrR family transcriptional regulator [Pirellulales bacterium]|jgi:AcrR family transcriptional regulator|nr:TetR/AcrR family transcriptional regulator [Pirellulales bacterium]